MTETKKRYASMSEVDWPTANLVELHLHSSCECPEHDSAVLHVSSWADETGPLISGVFHDHKLGATVKTVAKRLRKMGYVGEIVVTEWRRTILPALKKIMAQEHCHD